MTTTNKLIDWINGNPPPGYTGDTASETLALMLYHIHAHPSLAFLPLVVGNIRRILKDDSEADWQLTTVMDSETLEHLHSMCEWLFSHQQTWIELISETRRFPPSKKSDKHPFLNKGISTHPFYGLMMIRNDQSDEENQNNLLRLQRLFLPIHWSMMQKLDAFDGFLEQVSDPGTRNHEMLLGRYKSCIYEASKSALRLTLPKRATELSEFISLNSISQLVTRAKRTQSVKQAAGSTQRKIETFATYALSYQKPQFRRSSPRKSYSTKRNRLGYGYLYLENNVIELSMQRDEYDLSYNWPDFTLIQMEKSEEESFSDEISPLESAGANEAMVFRDIKEIPTFASIRNSARHIQKAHQLLPHQWENLTTDEIAQSLAYAKTLLTSRHERKKQYSGLLVVIQIATGLSLERSESILISRNGYKFGESVPVYWLPEEAKQGFWCIPAYQIDYKTQQEPQTLESLQSEEHSAPTRELTSHLLIPDLFEFDQWLIKLERLPETGTSLLFEGNLFRETKVAYPKLLKELHVESRVSPSRLSSVLRQYLLSTGADIVDYSLISGNPHRLSTVKAHYSAPSTSSLIAKYLKATRMLLHDLTELGYCRCLSDNHKLDPAYLPDKTDNQHVGSRYCPKTESIQNLVSTLREAIEDPDTTTIDFHNSYTLYITLLIGYSTGIRGIRTPYIDWSLLEPETGLLLMSDKNTPDAYHSRWVWLPDLVQQQVRLYERYLTRFNDANEPYKVRGSLFDVDPTWNDPVLFVTESLQPQVVRPKTIRERLGQLFPGAANHNRHWLRTYLSERRIPHEAIDQFLGHWSLGEEPFGTYSTTSPRQLLEYIKPAINDALNRLGFQLLRPTLHHRRVTL